MALFGTNGIRGDAASLFTNQFCFDIGQAFSQFLQTKKLAKKVIVFGMDSRTSSSRIKSAVTSGLGQEWDIWDEGIIPTPALNYFIKQHDCAGIMVTGSHIEKNLNGLKFFVGLEEITKQDETVIEKLYFQIKQQTRYQPQKRLIKKEANARQVYTQMLVKLARSDFQGWQVAVDPGNGTQSEIIPDVLRKLQIQVLAINADPTKPLLSRDTEIQDAFPKLRQAVFDQQANLGIGYDSDGDRAIFIDDTGQPLTGETSCSIIAQYSPDPTIVTPINTSTVVEKIGKKVIRTKVGVLYVVAAMKKHGTNVGFESNGGFVSGEIFYGRDAGTATIKMLNLLKKTGKKLSELTAALPKYYIIKDKVDCPSKINDQILAAAVKKYQGKKIEDQDGVKIWIDPNSWILFRPSGNAPEFRVFAESLDQAKTQQLAQEGMALVKSVLQSA